MPEIGNLRRLFFRMILSLSNFILENGYEASFEFAKRCENCPVGHKNSLHKIGLAMDLNIYRDGQWLNRTEDLATIGEFWETIGGTWGGRFNDGNHFSLEYGGMK